MAPKERALRHFSISDSGRADRSFYVAGYTLDDCCMLLAHAEGVKNPAERPYSASHLSTYGSKMWGNSPGVARLDAKKRGVWLVEGDLHWRDQSGTKITFIEPPPERTSSELFYWIGPSPTMAWDRIIICAHDGLDAVQLLVEAGGAEASAKTDISKRFERVTDVPERYGRFFSAKKRGATFTDKTGSAVSWIEPKSRPHISPATPEEEARALAQATPTDYGKLRTGFDRGVKVDVWTFRSAHGDRALGDGLSAEVRMEKVDRDGERVRRTRHGSGIEFVAHSKIFAEPLRDTNIETLFDRVQDAFRTYELGKRGIVWEDWLEVEIVPADTHDATKSAGFAVGYRPLKRGVDPRNGKVYSISDRGDGIVIPFPKAKKAGEKFGRDGKIIPIDEDNDDYFRRDVAHQYAYLPATPENIAALDTVCSAIDRAMGRLQTLLMQESIAKSLASIPTINLLEAK